ncbi:DUF4148 domain-containing protein [Paraburkholderia megapolitana]|uniref:DUF4148 domain-containing protein n=1 Tax=Paraburkholderia megapolitana TaxID=420953 RepID=A0A1I3DX80_9BURK|nr:DUF4148 domain-containing protein [Paraburkholderia megapolitana]SFH91188.1 protein of unknown function [Paraburkholderia megapolitana]
MKSFIPAALLVAAALAVPAVSFAQQSDSTVTRAQVRAELVSAQQAGLLSQPDPVYPRNAANVQTVASVAPQGDAAVGSVAVSRSQWGVRTAPDQGIFATYRGQ